MKFFKQQDFKCTCGRDNCDAVEFDVVSLKKLEDLRASFGEPIVITSGSRCQYQNGKVNGEENSQHLLGRAVDISCPNGEYLRRLLIFALQAGYTGVGVKKRMIHLDTRPGTPVVWGY